MSEDRLTRIEEALAHQTRVTEDLSQIVEAQDTRIARLERRLGLLLERAAEQEFSTGGSVPLADQKPPHY